MASKVDSLDEHEQEARKLGGNYPALLGLDCKSRPEATETVRALSTEPPDVPSGGSGWVVTLGESLTFLQITERSRVRYRDEGGLSLDEVRRRFGLLAVSQTWKGDTKCRTEE